MQKQSVTYAPEGTDYRLALGLSWVDQNTHVNPAAIMKIAKNYGANASAVNPSRKSQVGLTHSSDLKQQLRPGALIVATTYKHKAVVVLSEILVGRKRYYWLVAADKGVIVQDTDLIIEDEQQAKQWLAALIEQFPLAEILAPAGFTDQEVAEFEFPDTVSVTVPNLESIRSSVEQLFDFVKTPKGAVITFGLIAVIFVEFGGDWLDSRDQAAQERERLRLAATQQERADIQLELRRTSEHRRLITPWLDHPPADIFAEGCIIEGYDKLVPVPGWSLEGFQCSNGLVELTYSREDAGFIQTARNTYTTQFDFNLSDENQQAIYARRFAVDDYSRLRISEKPLERLDARQYLSDLFVPHGGTVDFADPREQPHMAEAAELGLEPSVLVNFTVITSQQPEQWAMYLRRVPTVIVSAMTIKDFKNVSWEITGTIHVQRSS